MPRYTRRVHASRPATAPTESERIEREILADELRHDQEMRETGHRWAKRMVPLFWLGQGAFLLLVLVGPQNPVVGVEIAVISTALNAAAAHALRRAAVVARDRFPVRFIFGFKGMHYSVSATIASFLALVGIVLYILHVH
jgi:uncharacterized membrane protein